MNELPIMPIRAKYADELSEGSPDKVKIEQLEQALGELDSNSAKVLDLSDKEPDDFDIQDFIKVVNGKYTAIEFSADKFWTIQYIEEGAYFSAMEYEDYHLYVYKFKLNGTSITNDFIDIDLRHLTLREKDNANIGDVLTLNNNKAAVWQAPAEPGTKWYHHDITVVFTDDNVTKTMYVRILSTYKNKLETISAIKPLNSIYGRTGTYDGKLHYGKALTPPNSNGWGAIMVPDDMILFTTYHTNKWYYFDQRGPQPYIYSFTGGLVSNADNQVVQDVSVGNTGISPTSITDTVTEL